MTDAVTARVGSGLWADPHAQIAPEMIPSSGGSSVKGRASATYCLNCRDYPPKTILERTGFQRLRRLFSSQCYTANSPPDDAKTGL
jgi:hypothetical protein